MPLNYCDKAGGVHVSARGEFWPSASGSCYTSGGRRGGILKGITINNVIIHPVGPEQPPVLQVTLRRRLQLTADTSCEKQQSDKMKYNEEAVFANFRMHGTDLQATVVDETVVSLHVNTEENMNE